MIYFLQAPAVNAIKIGWSKKVENRVARIASSLPFATKLLGVIDGGRLVEAGLHRQWARIRLKGEWFRSTEDLVREIERLVTARDTSSVVPDQRVRERTCQACGSVSASLRKPRAGGHVCRSCASRARQVPTLAPCLHCGAPRSRTNKTGLCKSCGMRSAWDREDYRSAVVPSRQRHGRACRKTCGLCGLSEPKVANKFHAHCWAAENERRKRQKQCGESQGPGAAREWSGQFPRDRAGDAP